MKVEKVLIVDDDEIMRDFLEATTQSAGMEAFVAPGGHKALEILKKESIDLLLTDMQMPKMSGMELIKKAKEVSPSTLIVVITAFGSVDNAVEAMQKGAFHYLLKPFTPDALETIIQKANEHCSLVGENTYLKESSVKPQSKVIGKSPAMQDIIRTVERISESNASVFIHGESGTGKEVVAHLIHEKSTRSGQPFIKVNCAAIPETLIESEFFGHEKGAFTGATSRRLGRFELAHQGSLLLDEISEIPAALQAKLLRVTQEKEFERVGGTKPIKVDVRLISTSNRKIEELTGEKIMREDLFYRLNVVPIYIPPLRQRQEDIPPLCEHFVHALCKANNRMLKHLTPDALEVLVHYPWPGNVRELQNVIERVIVSMDPKERDITADDLFLSQPRKEKPTPEEKQLLKGMTLKELEKKLIVETLLSHGKNEQEAARSLGISEAILKNKLREYDIK